MNFKENLLSTSKNFLALKTTTNKVLTVFLLAAFSFFITNLALAAVTVPAGSITDPVAQGYATCTPGNCAIATSSSNLTAGTTFGQILTWDGTAWVATTSLATNTLANAGTTTLNLTAVVGATSTGIFFLGADGKLSQDTDNFNYDPISHKLTLTGGLDPLWLQAKDASNFGGAYYEAYDGNNAGVSLANTGRLRYSTSTQSWEVSTNGGAYAPIVVSGSNIILSNATIANATTTNLFSTLLNAVTAIFTNLFFTNGTGTNATVTNSFVVSGTSNLATATIATATIGSLNIGNLSAPNLTGQDVVATRSLTNTGTTTLATTTISAGTATLSEATTTNLFATLFNSITSFITNLTSTNATITNATSTNIYSDSVVANLIAPLNVRDSYGATGTAGQLLSNTGTSTKWVNAPSTATGTYQAIQFTDGAGNMLATSSFTYGTTTGLQFGSTNKRIAIDTVGNVTSAHFDVTADEFFHTAFYFDLDLNGTPDVINSPITLVKGQLYRFYINTASDPFYLTTNRATAVASAYTNGVSGNGTNSGIITFRVPQNAPSRIYYQSSANAAMGGTIYIVDPSTISNDNGAAYINATTTSMGDIVRLFASSTEVVTITGSGAILNGTTTIATTTISSTSIVWANITNLFASILNVLNLNFTNATGTNATTTNFFATNSVNQNALTLGDLRVMGTTTLGTATIAVIQDSYGTFGTVGQVLTTSGTSTKWATPTAPNVATSTYQSIQINDGQNNLTATSAFAYSTTTGLRFANNRVAILTNGTVIAANFDVTNSPTLSYNFDFDFNGVADVANPSITLVRGQTYNFNINTPGDAFYIKTVKGTGTGNQYTNGIAGNGTSGGTLTFTVPFDAPSVLFYQSSNNSAPNGSIYILDSTQLSDKFGTTRVEVGTTTADGTIRLIASGTEQVVVTTVGTTLYGTTSIATATIASTSITWANITNLFASVLNVLGLTAENATITNATTTNFAVANINATNSATLASTTLTGNTIAGTLTAATTTLATTSISNATIAAGTANLSDATVTNSTSTNLSSTNANLNTITSTGTSSFATTSVSSSSIVWANITNLFASILNVLGLTAENATITNATTTNFASTNTNAGTLTAATTTLATTSISNATIAAGTANLSDATVTNSTSTNISTTNLTSANTNAGTLVAGTTTLGTTTISTSSISNLNVLAALWANMLTVLGLNATDATITNATTTNFAAGNITATGNTALATTTIATATIAAGTANLSDATITNATVSLLSVLNIRDSYGATGTAGQVLTTTGTSTKWGNLPGSATGTAGLVQLTDGAGNLISDANVAYSTTTGTFSILGTTTLATTTILNVQFGYQGNSVLFGSVASTSSELIGGSLVIGVATSTGLISTTTNALYNVNGTLYFNGVALGVAGQGTEWTNGNGGTLVRLATTSNQVVIGASATTTAAALEVNGFLAVTGLNSQFLVTGTSTLATTTVTDLTATNILANGITATTVNATTSNIRGDLTVNGTSSLATATIASATLTNANIYNLFATIANFLGLTATDATITNATSSNIVTGNLTATGTTNLATLNAATTTLGSTSVTNLNNSGNSNIAGTLNVTGTSTQSTSTVSSSSITWANITNLFASMINAVQLNVTGTSTLATTTTSNLTVNDAAIFASTTPSTTTNALYNNGGNLYFNGNPIGNLIQASTAASGTIAANTSYSVDATLSGLVLNLPAAPANGTVIQIKDVKGLFSTNPILVQASTTVDDVAGSGGVSLTTAYGVTTLYYNAANTTWNVNTALPTPTTLARARMTKTAGQNITNTTAKITFTSTPSYNIGNIGDSGASRVTVAQAGIYAVNANIEIVAPASGSGNVCAIFYLNGAPANLQQCLPAGFTNGSTYQLSFSDVLNLSAGDFVEVFLQNQNGVAAQVTAANTTYTVQQQPTAAVSIQSTAASYVLAKAVAGGTVTINDEEAFPFDTVVNTAGSDITLSNPQFTLKAGHTYKLDGALQSNANVSANVRWYDVTNAVYLGIVGQNGATAGTDQQLATTIITPTTDIIVELRNVSGGARTFYTSGASNYAYINEIAGNSPVVGSSVDYVSVKRTGTAQTITAAGFAGQDIVFNTTVTGNIGYNTGTGAFSLSAGKTYDLTASLRTNFTGATDFMAFEWVDSANTSLGGTIGQAIPTTFTTTNESGQVIAHAIYTPSSNTTVKLRAIVTGTALTGDASVHENQSFATVMQLGSSAMTQDTVVAVGGNTILSSIQTFKLGSLSQSALSFITNGIERLFVATSTTNVGIGTNNVSGSVLTVATTSTTTSVFALSQGNNTANFFIASGTPVGIASTATGSLAIDTASGRLYIASGSGVSDWTAVGASTATGSAFTVQLTDGAGNLISANTLTYSTTTGVLTNTGTTSLATTTIAAGSANLSDATITNATATNANIATIVSTGTSSFATTTVSSSSVTWLNVLGTLWANTLAVLGFTAENATITNATTSNFATANLTATGTSALATTTIATATIGNATINSGVATLGTATIATATIAAGTANLSDATVTNSTSTNISTTNLTSANTNAGTLVAATTTLGTTTISTSTISNLNVLATLWANTLRVLGLNATNATITNSTTTNIFANALTVSSTTQSSTTAIASFRNSEGLTNFYIASGTPAGITPVATGSLAIDSASGNLYIARGTATSSWTAVGTGSGSGTASATGTAGAVQFTDGTTLTATSTFVISTTSGSVRLGLGTSTPNATLDVVGNIQNLISSTSPATTTGFIGVGVAPKAIATVGKTSYVVNSTSNTLSIVNTANPASPSVVATIAVGTSPSAVAVSGKYAYVTNQGVNSISIIDISTTTPSVVSTVVSALGTSPSGIAISGRYLFVSNIGNDTVTVFDALNPSAVREIGSTSVGTSPTGIAVQGNYAYVANSNQSTMSVVDIGTPTAPSQVGSVIIGTNPTKVAVQGNYAYVTNNGDNTVSIVNVTNPTSPVELGTAPTASGPTGVSVAGRYVFVTGQSGNALSIIDANNPAAAYEAKRVTLAGAPIDVKVSGRYAQVVTNSTNRVWVVDLGGVDTNTLVAGSIEAGTVNTGVLSALTDIFAGNGLFAGLGGVTTQGRILASMLGITGQGTFGTSTMAASTTLSVAALSDAAPAGLTLMAYGTASGTTPTTASTSELRFAAPNGNYVGLKAPGTIGTSTVWTLPGADGLANQIMVTNGQGVLGWGSAAVAAGTNQIQFTNNGGSQSATSTFSYADSQLNPYGTLILATTSTSSLLTGAGLATNAIYAGGNVKIGAKVVNGTAVGNALVIDSATTSWATTTNALYNNNGTLYWNGVAISSNATGTSFMPVLYNESSRNGQAGLAFIFKSQIYTFGYAITGTPYSPYGFEGTSANSPKLAPVVNAPNGWNEIAAAPTSICALSNVGTVYCMGENGNGQLGLGDTTDRLQFEKLTFPGNAGLITKIYSVTNDAGGGAGTGESYYAIDANGRVFAWGYNGYGQLGNGNTTNATSPVQTGSGVWSGKVITKIAVGNQDTGSAAAIDSTGQLYTWGRNDQGQLGQGDTTNRNTPTAVAGFTNVTDMVLAGTYDSPNGVYRQFTRILRADGTTWATGDNTTGQLADGTNSDRTSFVQSTGISNVQKIFAGSSYTGGWSGAIDASGYVYFAGRNNQGEFGLGDTSSRNAWQAPSGSFQGKVVKVVATGDSSTNDVTMIAILDSDGNVWTAGNASFNGREQSPVVSTLFDKVVRNTDGKKVVDIRAYGNYPKNSSGNMAILIEDGSMMTSGHGTALGQDQTTTLSDGFKYVAGFEPGSKGTFTSVFTAMNAITGASGNNTIENAAYSQAWNWGSLGTTTGMELTASALTSGKLLALNSTAQAQTGSILNITASGGASSTGLLAQLNITSATSQQKALQLLNIGTGLTMDVQGAVAFRKGSDFSGVGTQNNANLGNASLVRLTGISAQIITGIASGADGRMLTLMNAGNATATISNQSGLSTTANRIITGQGADMLIGPNQSVLMVYDSSSLRWRVVGGAGGNGSTIVQTLATSTVAEMPVLVTEDTLEAYGHMFIYKNQIYTMGNADAFRSGGSPNTAGSPVVVPVNGFLQLAGHK
jgi:YVTN family beta-propeller protein